MRRVSKKAAVFDVPEEFKDIMDRLVLETENRSLKGYEVILVNSMEMLEEEDESENRNTVDEEIDERDLRDAMRNKRDW